jgi:hypothetical protein
MKTASWALLALAGFVVMALSVLQVARAYGSFYNDRMVDIRIDELAPGRPEIEVAVRARRATAGAYGAGFGALFLMVALGPYRRGEVWAWWALLASMALVSLLILLRIPFLDTGLGGSTGGGTASGAVIQLLLVAVGLALDAGRLRGERKE